MPNLLNLIKQSIDKRKEISSIKQRNTTGSRKFSSPLLTPEQEYAMSHKGDSKDAEHK